MNRIQLIARRLKLPGLLEVQTVAQMGSVTRHCLSRLDERSKGRFAFKFQCAALFANCFIAALLPHFATAALLVEIRHQASDPNHSAGETTGGFGFIAWGMFSQIVTMTDVGKTFSTPVGEIPDFQFGLTRHTPFAMIFHFGRSEAFLGSEALMNMHFETHLPGIIMDRFVPVLGPALVGYKITDITRTIDRFDAVHVSGSTYTHFGTQTIRIHGETIPPLPGDFNQNGDVDAADYVVWRDRVEDSKLMPNGVGEGIFEGRAVPQDYDYWRANFGRTAFPEEAPGASVPEPDTRLSIGFSILIAAMCLSRAHLTSSACRRRNLYQC